ncbi:MAG: hypothetical protein V4719_05120 [Planctomycetota bacterium]
MARKTQNRMDLRKQAEAADAQNPDESDELELDDDGDADLDAELDLDLDDDDSGDDAPKRKKRAPKKKPAAARPKRTKTKAVVRKRMLWGVFSSSMKEEGRFPYAEKEQAEARAEALHQKNKKEYFVQPIKEPIAEPPSMTKAEKAEKDKAEKAEKAAKAV